VALLINDVFFEEVKDGRIYEMENKNLAFAMENVSHAVLRFRNDKIQMDAGFC
jgi:hypothetical protein